MHSSSKQINKGVIKMYAGKPYIETQITLYTPLENTQLHENFKSFPIRMEDTLKGMNKDVEDIVMETFNSDIHSIYSGVKNLYK